MVVAFISQAITALQQVDMPRGEGANGGLEGGVKLSDLIPKFDGTTDVSEWLQQLEIARVAVNVADIAKVLPAFLRGDAFKVYANLPLDKKKNYEDVAEALTTAFGVDEHVAFGDLVTRHWRDGEPVDVYVAELWRLASLAVVPERVVRMVLLNGLPTTIGMQLKTTPGIKAMSLDQVVALARSLMAAAMGTFDGGPSGSVAGCVSLGGGPVDVGAVAAAKGRRLRCFGCSKEGHFVRDCPQRRKNKKREEPREEGEASGNGAGL